MASGHPAYKALTQAQVARIERGAWYHTIELPDGTAIPGLIGLEPQRARMDAFGVPHDLTGKRVLDVGAATGWCSFEAERRGAAVVAVDCVEYEDFRTAQQLLHSKTDYRILDVDELNPESLGVFDYVFFFGVLYHLRHPLLGLERVCALTRDTAYVESFVCDGDRPPEERVRNGCYMEFYETDQLGGQIDNWVGPTANCLLALCRSAGFARVELTHVLDRRAGVVCRRHWEAPPASPAGPAPRLNSAVNNRTNDTLFHPGKDEYICVYFETPEQPLTPGDLRVEVDGAGAPVLHVAALGRDRWQANLRVPPGLAAGPHAVRLRTGASTFGNSFQIQVGASAARDPAEPLPPDAVPELLEVENGMNQTAEFHGYRSEYLSCRFRLAVRDLDREDATIDASGRECAVDFVTNLGSLWQTNSKLPPGLPAGTHEVRVKLRNGRVSGPMAIVVVDG